MMRHSSLIKEELSHVHVAHTRGPAAGSVGVTAESGLRQVGDCWWGAQGFHA